MPSKKNNKESTKPKSSELTWYDPTNLLPKVDINSQKDIIVIDLSGGINMIPVCLLLEYPSNYTSWTFPTTWNPKETVDAKVIELEVQASLFVEKYGTGAADVLIKALPQDQALELLLKLNK